MVPLAGTTHLDSAQRREQAAGEWGRAGFVSVPLRSDSPAHGAPHQLDNRNRARAPAPLDLTLDNVHLAEDLTVFDFDSAGTCWRAVEPWGVLRLSATYFQAWLAGYRTARPFGAADEAAVAAFGIVGDLRVVAWKLGVAASSRGAPLLGVRDLPAIVDGWLDWEAAL
jgi:hypothetical protein